MFITKKESPVVSFDFDGVLDYSLVRDYARHLSDIGFRVLILTSRPHDTLSKFQNNDELYEIADEINVQFIDIIFTNMNPKEDYLVNSKVIFHLDDDKQCISMVNSVPGFTRGVLYTDANSAIEEIQEILLKNIDSWSSRTLAHMGFFSDLSSKEVVNSKIINKLRDDFH